MTRRSHPPRAARATPDVAVVGDDGLRLPDDWNDGAVPPEPEAAAPDDLDCVEKADEQELEHARQQFATFMSSPQQLLRAMLALDKARNEEDIAAARAILRVSAF